ncbi:MAG TPA: 3-dehydroquinate synthase family protein [Rectinemataceae bacterium]|nr:3-dehydroquinate synthase family protein [Rectinemataceae bacterium]
MEIRVRGRDGESLVRIGPVDAAVDFPPGGPPTLIVTEPEVFRLYGARLPDLPRSLVARGEAAKSIEGLEALWDAFLAAGLDRESRVIAFGGGAVSDLAGFAAATWMRGIAFEYLPTSLLAMVDAAVGGKTAIDFRGRKNLVGVFCQPRRVLCDVAFLDSLSDLEFASGMGEVIKHALLAGGDYLDAIEGLAGIRPRADSPSGRVALEGLVAGSVACKASIVNRDEREEGDRRLLNLGHSIGHALESVLAIPHGHAVAAGLASAARLSEKRNLASPSFVARVAGLLRAWNLPSSIEEATALSAAKASAEHGLLRKEIAAVIGADKKRTGNGIRFVFPLGPASMKIERIPLTELEAFAGELP